MKSTLMRLVVVASLGMVVAACTGLQQFPKVSKDYAADLKKIDPDYEKALAKINAKDVSENEKERIRNEEIDRRLRVIDLNFSEFRRGLAKEGVAADFGVALVQLGLGGAGSLVSETVSQILSATSAGLAGAQQAYSKAALYEKTVSALLAQMIASRKAVLVNIFTGRTKGIDDYPLSAAVLDLEAYEYAGSLPGAVIGTSADATVKNKAAEVAIKKLFLPPEKITMEVRKRRKNAADYVWTLDETNKVGKLKSLAKELGISEDENARDGILDKITVARTAEDMDVIEQAIKRIKAQ